MHTYTRAPHLYRILMKQVVDGMASRTSFDAKFNPMQNGGWIYNIILRRVGGFYAIRVNFV